jgi:hypothetical protein
MGLWQELRQAAHDAASGPPGVRDVLDRVRQQRRKQRAEPPTLLVDASGRIKIVGPQNSVVLLCRTLLLLTVSLFAMGLAWLGTGVLALVVWLQRLLGVQLSTAPVP